MATSPTATSEGSSALAEQEIIDAVAAKLVGTLHDLWFRDHERRLRVVIGRVNSITLDGKRWWETAPAHQPAVRAHDPADRYWTEDYILANLADDRIP